MSPRTPQASIEEAHALTRRLFEVVEVARRDFAAIAHEHGLTALQARAILMLEEPQPMARLAADLACDASNVTGLADRLEKTGAIERVTGTDRRIKLLSLTPQGVRLRAGLAGQVAAGSAVTARLTRTERAELAALLDKLLTVDPKD